MYIAEALDGLQAQVDRLGTQTTATPTTTTTTLAFLLVTEFTLTTPVTTIGGPPVQAGKILVVAVSQDATGGRLLGFNSSVFSTNTPTQISMDPNAKTLYLFAPVASLWTCVSVHNPPSF